MKCLIADDEPWILKDVHRTAMKVFGPGTEFFLAENSDRALALLEEHTVQIALLDIEMPSIGGLELAKRIREKSPCTNVIFVTGHEKYALEAFGAYASDFLVKPVNEMSLRRAYENLRFPIPMLEIRCFGHFEVFYGGTAVNFKRSQCKEVLAFLIDKRGGGVSEEEIRYLLWSEAEDTEKKRRYVRNIISDVRAAFKECGLENIVGNDGKGNYHVDAIGFYCDYYDYLEGKREFSREELGSYMEQYDWAEGRRVSLRSAGC